MTYYPNNPNGQATMANSAPVVMASDQSALPTNADAAVGAGTAPGKSLLAGAVYNSTEISPTTGQTFALQADSKGRLRLVIMDAAGNTRGVNVNASNQLSVTVDNTATVAGGKTNNNAAPAATQLGVMPSLANAAAPTWTEGDQVLESSDLSGNQRVTQGTLLAGEDLTNNVIKVEERFSFSNITTGTTTTVKSGAGFLHLITINTPVASATITIYDNTAGSGTAIGKITLGATLANDVYGDFLYDVSFSTGLTLVTSGATDITVSYR